ncbi:hypothetical protein [Actinobacillus lignieresii]|uniref:Uncharacterized protein n=1 Tax=Actinobacillus lignieresii TaxID=720 RepID=A0A380TT02_ACTLI|nr:hypothetical protein [Actinobacillus lignieresii]SUT91234.1 Uncharacterised protein [Actinobacillus lignieresii]
MNKAECQKKVLKDHKKIGQTLIPPLMQLPNLQETSFREESLPSLIWISAIFLRCSDKEAVENIVHFITKCNEILNDEKKLALVFINNFNCLNNEQKEKIRVGIGDYMLNFLRKMLEHHHFLFSDYPLDFLFDNYDFQITKNDAVSLLKEDISALLDRYNMHATKVQTTAFYSMAVTGQIVFGPDIDIPNLNAILTAPESDESKRVGAFVRASLNGVNSFDSVSGKEDWAKLFWKQCFNMEACS